MLLDGLKFAAEKYSRVYLYCSLQAI